LHVLVAIERRSMDPHKLLRKALASPANLRFEEACALARAFGFHLSRVRGSHHIFAHGNVRELVNLQEVKGKAKPYQIKQLLALVEGYNLSLGGEE
jgi:predicted RNA binding protein YcfA (HicA-like mRNA interferase family)